MKQTAVEWLIEQLTSGNYNWKVYDQAKEMEKNQILEFTRNAVRKILDEDRTNPFNLENYYNETFKQQEQ
jgi:hypothetical protein